MNKRKKPDYSKKKKGIDTDAIILQNRIVFIYDEITSELALDVNKELMALDILSNDPITVIINSCGGSCEAGLSIMDTIKRVSSTVITLINGSAYSMGVHIALAGDVRWATPTSTWMNHDVEDFVWNTSQKIHDRAKFLDRFTQIFINQMKEKTKLSPKELAKAKNGELWFIGDELKEKGIVDAIV